MGADNGASDHDEVFDLDALERDDTPEPFAFTIGGRIFYLAAPSDVDWHGQTAFNGGDPTEVMPLLLGDQFADFDQFAIPGWKLDKLIVAWGRHNGITIPESPASSTSSRATGKPSRPTSAATTASGSRTSRRAG
jgi:hypothetical protein